MEKENKITITEQQIWDFVYKEICNVWQISKVNFALSDEYNGFKRRFNYYMKKLKENGKGKDTKRSTRNK